MSPSFIGKVFVNGEWRWPCPRCPRTYRNKRTITTHLSYECGKEPSFCCHMCEKRFYHKSKLKQHILFQHCDGTGVMRYQCDKCPKSYRHHTSLHKHRRYECGKEPQFECPICGKKFSQKINMKVHYSSVHRMSPLPINLW
ncbi:unnamed protein product [Cyprideis torosa]|uniref:Uncharacterized protein n=1 Tax=Cyprideis torosa TaxID=163714 RepID=A0A7R8ZJK2_9CRUS|nr:unnamed protein product [Cyprideis torosa]CAG0882466.1 unnamed protein product [Cyprideis torosa]